MRRNRTTIDSLIIVATKTVIAYVVFTVFLFTVPIYKQIKTTFADTDGTRMVIGESIVFINTADTASSRKEGLSFRESLKEDEGLLFIFDDIDFHGIWMRDMNFPIDIIWLDETQQVIHIENNISPLTFPEIFKPTEKALYVLEVPAGFAKTEGIKIGDQMTLF